MKSFSALYREASTYVDDVIIVPDHVHSGRKFYEGVICCFECRGSLNIANPELKKGSLDYNSWLSGWKYAEPIYLRSQGKFELADQKEHDNQFVFKEKVV